MLSVKAMRPVVAAVLLSLLTAVLILLGGGPAPPGPPKPALPCATLSPQAGWVVALAFSPNGTSLAIGTSKGNVQGECQIWDVASGQMRATSSRQMRAVSALCFSPDGCLLALADCDGRVQMWDVAGDAGPSALPRLDAHRALQLAFSSDGKTLAGGSNWAVTLWDVATGRERQSIPAGAPLAFSPDGKTLATLRKSGPGVQLWDVDTGRAHDGHRDAAPSLQSLDVRSTPEVLAYAPDWSALATGEFGRTAYVWDVARQEQRATLEGHEGTVTLAAFAPDSRTVATASEDRTIRLWDAATGRLRATLEGHTGAIHAVAFSPDGKLLASGGFDQTVRVWDLAQTP
jgi:hypothetical protein